MEQHANMGTEFMDKAVPLAPPLSVWQWKLAVPQQQPTLASQGMAKRSTLGNLLFLCADAG